MFRRLILGAWLSLGSACMFETEDPRHSARPDHFQYVGEARFSPPGANSIALAVSHEGTAYAAYSDASDSLRAVVTRYSPSSRQWEKLGGGGLSMGTASKLDLEMDPEGIPYLAFKDGGDSMRATVLRWEPDSLRWRLVGRKGATPAGISDFAFAMAPTGEPYLVYKDEQHGFRSTLLRYDKAGNAWNTVGDSGFTDAEGNFLSVAVDPAGAPYVGYYDEARTGRATVMRYAGYDDHDEDDEGWKTVGEPGFSRTKAHGTVLAIDSQGTPYLGYIDGFENTFKASVRRFASGSWTPLGEESFSSGQAVSLALAISPKGAPYVAFSNYDQGSALNLLRWDDSAGVWRDVGGAGLAAASGWAVALAFGPTGEPWFAFLDNDGSRLSVMRLGE